MEFKKPCLNVVMVPWLAHGHVSPYLELAKRLSTRNFHIYLCSTPINLAPIKKRITHKYSHSIELIEFHIPSQPDLPPHFHTTNGLPLHLNPTLKRAMDMAGPSFTEIIRTLQPDIIIHDFTNQQWAALAASSLGLPAVQFLSTSASILSYVNHKMLKQDIDFPYPAMNPRGTYWNQEFQKLFNQVVNDRGQSENNASPSKTCNVVFMKTFREIEGKYLEYSSQISGKKLVPTGPLVQDPEEEGEGEDESEIMEWLHKKETSSTVFVSFGTESFLSREETWEIGKGLELSMVNFIWVLRFPFEDKITIEEALPNGFLERVGDRGLVVEKWAPQARILGHPNVGGFVSHCGWGSTIEAMSFGVPIVAIPIYFDQPLNARIVEDIGVGLEVWRDEDGRFKGEEIAGVIREVVVGENGKKIRDKAREMREKIKSKGEEDIDGVVEELWKLHNENIARESKD